MTKPTVLFFARGYQTGFFPVLESDAYNSMFVTMTRAEQAEIERGGHTVVACFEAMFDTIVPAPVPDNYLLTSFMADRFLGRFDHVRRIEILGKQIAFWANLLDRFKPAAAVNELVAIEISEVLLIECRKRGIHYLGGMNCVVDDYFYWLPDPITISGRLIPADIVPGEDARASAADYIRQLLAKDYAPFYVKNLSGRRALKPVFIGMAKALVWWWRARRDRTGSAFKYEMYNDEYGKRLSVYFKGWFRCYDRLEDIPEGAEVIFYPLHQEPEATLNYMSEFYANQVSTIENILKCLGPNQVLVVKEHPVDKGSLLLRKFWDIRQRLTGLYYLPAEIHGRQVLARASRIVTLTSTVGWEAAVIGTPVYVLGEIFYDSLKGVSRIEDWRQLRRAMRVPADQAPRLDRARAEAFVAQMTEMSYRGTPFPPADIYAPTNVAHVVLAIRDAIGA